MSPAADGPRLSVDDLRRRPTITIREAADFLNISSDLAYASARRGELPVVSLGRRKLVVSARLLAMIGQD